jgi:hypothetical protein
MGEGVAGATAGLVDFGRMPERGEDRPQRILQRQHLTSGKPADQSASIHQGRRVGQKLQAAQQRGKPGRPLCGRSGPVIVLGSRDEARSPIHHLAGRLHGSALAVPAQVAFAEHRHGGQAQLQLIPDS